MQPGQDWVPHDDGQRNRRGVESYGCRVGRRRPSYGKDSGKGRPSARDNCRRGFRPPGGRRPTGPDKLALQIDALDACTCGQHRTESFCGDQRPSGSPKTKRGGSRRISRNCWSYCASNERPKRSPTTDVSVMYKTPIDNCALKHPKGK